MGRKYPEEDKGGSSEHRWENITGSEDEEHSAIHMVSAWLHDQKIVLGQIAVREKTNEITAVPDLVNMLEIEDCIVTADAMSCQVKRMLALCVNAKYAGEILNFFSALLTVFFLPILPCNTFGSHGTYRGRFLR